MGKQYQRWLKKPLRLFPYWLLVKLVNLTHRFMINGEPYQIWTTMSYLIVLLLSIDFGLCDPIMCNQWKPNIRDGLKKPLWLFPYWLIIRMVNLTHRFIINGNPYQIYAKLAFLIVSLLIHYFKFRHTWLGWIPWLFIIRLILSDSWLYKRW